MTKQELLSKVITDEAIMTKIVQVDTVEEVKQILISNGVELTEDELKDFIGAMRIGFSQEINENELDQVSGGFWSAMAIFTTTIDICKKVTKACDKVGKWLFDKGF